MSNIYLASNIAEDMAGNVSKVVDTNGREYVGGGEIFRYLFRDKWQWRYMDKTLMDNIMYINIYKALICIVIVAICIILILKTIGIRSLTVDKGIRYEVSNRNRIRKRDKKNLFYNRVLYLLVKLTDSKGFGISQAQREYMEYNLSRAQVLIPGGSRTLSADEFNALTKIGALFTALICLIVVVPASVSFGVIMIIISLIGWSVLPMGNIRSVVVKKDKEIKSEFFDFYIKIHYSLKNSESVRLSAKARSFAKVTRQPEAARFANTCADLWDLYGDGDGSLKIAREYRELPEVAKLMRLIKQYNDGAEIASDLDGFRTQLLAEKEFELGKKQERLIRIGEMSSNVLLLILAQAVISAMAVYLPDIMGAKGLF